MALPIRKIYNSQPAGINFFLWGGDSKIKERTEGNKKERYGK
jgi:hypothetical protein